MKVSQIGIIAVMLVVTAVALAGCTGSPASPSSGGVAHITDTPSGGSGAASSSSGSAPAASSGSVNPFSGLSYNWVEYKMSTGSGDQAMTIYMKYNHQTGKCTMRFEGAGASQMPASMQEMDCSSKGGSSTTQGDPNQVNPDAKVTCSPLEESVTVPAGTFSATKCSVTNDGNTVNTWIAKGKFMVKMEGSGAQGSNVNMVLNAFG